MKLCWFDNHRLGVVVGDRVHDVSEAMRVLPAPTYPAGPKGDALVAHLDAVRAEIDRLLPHAAALPVSQVKLLSPVQAPTKIIGVPVNYLKHVEEAEADRATFTDRYRGGIEEQGLFLKATSALVGPGEGVRVRFPERSTHHEMELGVVIGRPAANVTREDALSYVAGYCIALDMVVRGPEDRSLRKSIDSYAVCGPWLVTADEIPDPQALDLSLAVNGEPRQRSNTAHMIMDIATQIAWASSFYTLWPGDIIMTGTCEGVGPVLPGDRMHCEIDRIGAMDVPVTAA
ncbi:fumarylacetoacetate hydrolase family protein [Caldimonas thermodepolymerans]|jgi:2-keto-4-pentenoate hydratase/2-oxohepta-3-ene-1,7-dioic acid hydratase (catechol pathway)|uniref:2-keto-4-pentenoate hydratase/2-oxohepta-3-ene-1,7-dioic acid hydratase in catechol pathway n=1 Tax=Caldimonas thermodepolymerans TaxID=215580 RepID=A0A2S5SZY9_9BURK|nr:fumarylacetoacetate hydrolase family protein [Caldimonas thermodepolymerans]PPE68345.1 FAA hydrolase family protein [Caldimonas thermodepolymerans]QPC31220.1 fumarylacetoacetate hydrolase family protein [Caldimonas thermodepolymerans]RDH96680.1 2-keto-4-pentenoate hydratase/2-oxohepta-3-ene-1,7-dioic acid hydratase in catechol pathway [Caldimonas thermodepolymerans]TCP04722.1 2-keto-4-pentenoate hydratase/2-oxohepta-3-ene-1,7-dioic acid hydratase in catechol pathway [Caldimonas thermodepolym